MNLESRKYTIILFISCVGIIYLFRLFYMQVLDDSWKFRAQEIAERTIVINPPRGSMFDRNGKKVVSNKAYYNLMFIEKNIRNLDTVAFAKMVNMTIDEVRERFEKIRKKQGVYKRQDGVIVSNYQTIRAYPFLRELNAEEIANIAPRLNNFPGFFEKLTSVRDYPYNVGANVLGYVAESSREELEQDEYYNLGDNIGKSGVEKYYEKILRGQKGKKYVVTSALNNAIESFEGGKYDIFAVQSDPLILGMDVELQAYGEKLMKNKLGSIVAIEPATGEILAMVSSPSFDPNLLVGRSNISKNYPKLVTDPKKPLYPRPVQAEYPPGSIFKLTQALIGLQEGVIHTNSGFPCIKSWVGCHNHPMCRNVAMGVQISCNPYFYAVTKRIIQQGIKDNVFVDAEFGLKKWAEYLHSFGLGVRLETDIANIRSGLIPTPDYYNNYFPSKSNPYGKHRWAFSTIRSNSIGQGEVKVTPLQMANLAAIMANRGWFITPHIVKSIGEKGPLPQFKIKHFTKVNKKHFDPVIEGMRMAVNEVYGTARRARIDSVLVCGKTGTAQNPHGKDHSVFIAFAPRDNPKIAIAVIVENSGFGGTWAAPIASLMIEKYITGEVKSTFKEERILKAVLDED